MKSHLDQTDSHFHGQTQLDYQAYHASGGSPPALIDAHQRILGQDMAVHRLEQLLLGRARFQRQLGVERGEFEEVTVRTTGRWAAPAVANAFEIRDALSRAIGQLLAPGLLAGRTY